MKERLSNIPPGYLDRIRETAAGGRERSCSGSTESPDRVVCDQAVVVNLPLRGASGDFADVDELGERLARRVEATGVGELDGDLIGQDWGVIYLYGPDADRLWEAIEEVARASRLPAGAYVVKQHGPPGGRETRIEL